MKKYASRLLLLVCLYLCVCSPASAATHISLEKALQHKDLFVSLRSRGIYCGKGLDLRIRNASCREYVVEVPAGMIFRPDNPGYQPLAIAAAAPLYLKPDGADSCTLQTFCANAHAGSPSAGARYTFLKMADKPLMNVLVYLQEHGFMDYTGQHAVWAMTNDYAAAGVYSPLRVDDARKFAAFVAAQKKEAPPQFYRIYHNDARADGAVFLPSTRELVVELEWNSHGVRNMTCSILNADGTLYREFPGPEFIAGEHHRMHVVLPVADTRPGTYYVRARDEQNRVYDEHKIVLD